MGTAITHGSDNDRNVIAQVEYDKAGRMTALRDTRGKYTTYDYDGLDRRTLLTNPLDQQWTTAYERLSDGRTRSTQTDPLTYQTAQETDRAGRLATIQYLGESSPKPTPDVAFAYDKLGTRLRMTELDGATTVRETSYGYDAMRRLNEVAFDRDGNGSADETVTYAYDARGRRTKLTMPGDLEINYSYDAKGRLISLTDWDSQTAQHDYDAADRLRLTTEANGMTRGYSYDAASRLTEIHHSRYGKTLGFFGYSVDGRGNRTQVYERIPHATTGGNLTIGYDNAAVIYNGTWAESSPTGFIETSTTDANLIVIFYGDEAEVTLQKNPAGGDFELWIDGVLKLSDNAYAASEQLETYPLTGLGSWAHGLVLVNTGSSTTLQFQQVELIGDVILYEDQIVKYEYDTLSRVKQARYYAGANTGATPRRQYDYVFDVAGNRTQQSLALNGGSPTVDSYTYDAANRISNGGFSYDAAGRMTSDGVNTYTWDRVNRLLQMQPPFGAGYIYDYNGLGQRIHQSYGSVPVSVGIDYLPDVQPSLWKVASETRTIFNESTGTTVETYRYLHGPMGVSAQQDPNDDWVYLNADGLGTVRTVADGSANVLESRWGDPFGGVFAQTGTAQTMFGFTGEPMSENELIYLRARYYNPALSVFPSLDPLETSNRYSYVNGNPLNKVDPSGLCNGPDCDKGGARGQHVIMANGAPAGTDPSLIFISEKGLIQGIGTQGTDGAMLPSTIPANAMFIVANPLTRSLEEDLRGILTRFDYIAEIVSQTVSASEVSFFVGAQSTQTINDYVSRYGHSEILRYIPSYLFQYGNDPYHLGLLSGEIMYGTDSYAELAGVNAAEFTDSCAVENNDSSRVTLYHYTREKYVPYILATGLRPSAAIPGIPASDAQWGDGQYFTDLIPEESSTVTRGQHSYALFKNPRKWGTRGVLSNIAWIAFNLSQNDVDYRAPLFGPRFPQRSIYLRWNHMHPNPDLKHNLSQSLVVGQGLVTFRPTPLIGEIIP